MVFEGLWKLGGKLFKALTLSGVCESLWICGLRKKLGKNCQLTSQKLHFPRPNSSLKKIKNGCAKSQRTHFLSVLTDRVHWPSAIVRVTPLYWLCGRVVYLCVALLHHIHAANVCEKCVNCERIFCMNPVYSLWARHDSHSVGFSCELSFVMIWLARAAQVVGSPKPSVIPHETGFLNSLYIASTIN